MIRHSIVNLFIIVFSLAISFGCRELHEASRPTTAENPEWKLIEDCGYENCYPLVDYLVGKDIKIRIDPFNEPVVDYFRIPLIFIPNNKNVFTFNPSMTTVTFKNGNKVNAKGFFRITGGLNYLRSAPSLQGSIPLDKNEVSVNLFFDVPQPSMDEEFILTIKGLSRSGEPVNVPDLHFRKGMRLY